MKGDKCMRGNYMLSAVTRALSSHFEGRPPVVKEITMQDTPKEFLFVQQLNHEQSPDNGCFFNRNYFFDVRYHPNKKELTQNERITKVEEQLLECLAMIATDDRPIRAALIKTEVQDGVLHCFVDYPVRVMREREKQPGMNTLVLDEKLKE